MSSATTPRADGTATDRPLDCDRDECGDTYRPGTGHLGHCSEMCWSLATAERLLNGVHSDHRRCASCYRKLREVIPPGRAANSSDRYKDIPECVIGWAIPEDHCITGEGEILTSTHTLFGMEVAPSDQTTQRQICPCGVTHHSTVERPTLSKPGVCDHLRRLSAALEARRERGCHDYAHQTPILLHAGRKLKSKDRFQWDDDAVIRRALAVALRVGEA